MGGAYLALKDEGLELVGVDPMETIDDGHGTEDPPRVADVFELLRATVEAAAFDLPFAEPSTEFVFVNEVQSSRNSESCHTGEDLSRVGFRTG